MNRLNYARTHASTALAFRDASYACPISHYTRGGWMVRMCRFFCGESS